MLVKFAVDGTPYTYDSDTLLVPEARYVQRNTGLRSGAFLQGIMAMDGDALAGMVFLSKRRAGEQVSWSQMEELNLVPLIQSIADRSQEAAEVDNTTEQQASAEGEDETETEAALLGEPAAPAKPTRVGRRPRQAEAAAEDQPTAE